MRTTKILATLGPASDTPEAVRHLLEAGVDVFRLNASHGTQEDHSRRMKNVRSVAEEMGIHAGVLMDLQGPKIRLGAFEDGGCVLETKSRFSITTEQVVGTAQRASTSYKDFVKDVKAGNCVLLADGSVELRVIDKTLTDAVCEVVSGGPISDRKGINLPGVEVSTPSLTKKDRDDLRFGLEMGIDFVAISFVRRREDVLRLRLFLEESDSQVPVIAKIEKPEGWENLNEILVESDGVIVARGDLGVEMALEKVPFIQKSIIERARNYGKFVITATQMLETMIDHPYPTRAEVSDIANAIYDGTDAVMLSAETSSGKYPVEAARMMSRIASEAEQSIRGRGYTEPPTPRAPTYTEIAADMAYRAAKMQGAKAIIAFTASPAVARQLSLIYGIRPVLSPDPTETDEMIKIMDRILLQGGWLKEGDSVVFVAGQPIGRSGSTNLVKLHRIGELW
jgi:pyruvate kinase